MLFYKIDKGKMLVGLLIKINLKKGLIDSECWLFSKNSNFFSRYSIMSCPKWQFSRITIPPSTCNV